MGTNYYLQTDEKPPCDCCGRPYERPTLHIGKSSSGWCFILHVIPEEGINSLEDWKARWSQPGTMIVDEYDRPVTPEHLLRIITERSGVGAPIMPADWLRRNDAEPGPNGLARHVIGSGFCTGHGEGTWDLSPRDFS